MSYIWKELYLIKLNLKCLKLWQMCVRKRSWINLRLKDLSNAHYRAPYK